MSATPTTAKIMMYGLRPPAIPDTCRARPVRMRTTPAAPSQKKAATTEEHRPQRDDRHAGHGGQWGSMSAEDVTQHDHRHQDAYDHAGRPCPPAHDAKPGGALPAQRDDGHCRRA